jgi:hypothetical protein
MRKLTITRRRTFVGCAGKLKVYVVDNLHNDLDVCGESCRLIGTLKNGETKSFDIDENKGRVYVLFDKASRNWCNDSRPIPEGKDDVALTGICKFNPFAGNAYRFDGKADEVALENKKTGLRKWFLTMLLSVLVGMAIGYFIVQTSLFG